MPDAREARGGSFQEARSAFDKLNTQDKVSFVVEATFAAVGQAIEETGRHLTSLMDDVTEEVDRSFRRARAGHPGPEQPPYEPSGTASGPGTEDPNAGRPGRGTGSQEDEGTTP